MCPVMPCLSSSTCQADAIFPSALQRSDEPSASQVRQAVATAIGAFGYAGLRPRDRDLLSVRYLRDLCIDDIAAELALLCFEKSNTLGNARRGVKASDTLGDHPRDLGWRQLAV